ncbi:hypothetical protein D3C80_1853700 [compost metagenome]
MPGRQVLKQFTAFGNPPGFQVWLGILQALIQLHLIIRLAAQCDTKANRLAESGITHRHNQGAVCRRPVAEATQWLL